MSTIINFLKQRSYMQEISGFQFIRMAEGRIVIRYYNEDRDKFEKVCSARCCRMVNGHLLVADDRYYYDFNGRLYHLGCAVCVLSSFPAPDRLMMVDASCLPLPFKALFLSSSYELCTEAESHELAEDCVKVKTPAGQRYVYRYTAGEPDYDCHVDYFLERSLL